SGALTFQFDFKGFLPRHVLPMLIVNRHEDIAQFHGAEVVWQNGVLLRPNSGVLDAEALVTADYHNRKVDILVKGTDAVEYLSILRDSIHRTLKTMPELPYEERVRLRPDMRSEDSELARIGNTDAIWMAYNIIRTAQKRRIPEIPGPDDELY